MDSVHDVGGMDGFGKIEVEKNEQNVDVRSLAHLDNRTKNTDST